MHILHVSTKMFKQKTKYVIPSSMSFFTRPSIGVMERKSLKIDTITVLKKRRWIFT